MSEIVACQQGTDEWFASRLGKITASEFANVLCKGAGRGTYMLRLAAERLTGITQSTFSNSAMEWGTEHEGDAREYYETVGLCEVQQVGFVIFDEWIGGSPDGLVGEDGLLEIKCPNSSTHITNILKDKMPPKYVPQVQGLLWITGREWCDFVSYDPRVTSYSFFCKRIFRDDEKINILSEAANKFKTELQGIIETINSDPF